MKKILFVMSILTLMSYGCNKNDQSAMDTGMQEERMDDSSYDLNDTPEALEDDMGRDSQREEVRPIEDSNDAHLTEPMDERPNLDEDR